MLYDTTVHLIVFIDSWNFFHISFLVLSRYKYLINISNFLIFFSIYDSVFTATCNVAFKARQKTAFGVDQILFMLFVIYAHILILVHILTIIVWYIRLKIVNI